ncbi:YhcH/YjgK/YiaL family protein [Helicobacter cappadocius]|uniref:YhcH/YjgK/YiaL family protein n=1 Tax=Helicobacter cappadocius TaxID=3063998 RepID=A0AA90PKA0_9HELI|nr:MULTISPECIES: YhcH/YjgK/YiaL family protein [unclassified Helicobacter]MDO7253548.1 YhcH/YjgK/YiaL family protein [Helicobacter sp. faydin-H75]MDP2539476.1 YhcH/YjgK/YiaL family protein [Helicobacter sp. faydin-H76]
MAIIGKLHSLESLFQKNNDLKYLYSYMSDAINPNHPSHQHTINTPLKTENKSDLINGMFAIAQSYPLKSIDEAFYETHIKYIDFQLVVKGVEFFEIGDKNDFEIKTPYNEQKDLIIYNKNSKTSKIRLDEGMLAIFFDNDVHAGGLSFDNIENNVSKIVIKVPRSIVKVSL